MIKKTEFSVSQNYYRNNERLSALIREAHFAPDDIVLDIGAGKGFITKELVKYSNNVLAIEPDNKIYEFLKNNLEDKKVKLLNIDFEKYILPNSNFKTFSNIPFAKTAEIMNKLLGRGSKLVKGYIFMQAEAINKFCGEQVNTQNTMLSVIYGARYKFNIRYHFDKRDFSPMPSVNIDLLEITKRGNDEIKINNFELFEDFVAYIFNRSNPDIYACKNIITDKMFSRFLKDIGIRKSMRPTDLRISDYMHIFNVVSLTDKVDIFRGYYRQLKREQSKVTKIHRTRSF